MVCVHLSSAKKKEELCGNLLYNRLQVPIFLFCQILIACILNVRNFINHLILFTSLTILAFKGLHVTRITNKKWGLRWMSDYKISIWGHKKLLVHFVNIYVMVHTSRVPLLTKYILCCSSPFCKSIWSGSKMTVSVICETSFRKFSGAFLRNGTC